MKSAMPPSFESLAERVQRKMLSISFVASEREKSQLCVALAESLGDTLDETQRAALQVARASLVGGGEEKDRVASLETIARRIDERGKQGIDSGTEDGRDRLVFGALSNTTKLDANAVDWLIWWACVAGLGVETVQDCLEKFIPLGFDKNSVSPHT